MIILNRTLWPGNPTLGIIDNGSGAKYLVTEALAAGFIVGVYTQNDSLDLTKSVDFIVRGKFNDYGRLESFIERCNIVTYTGTTVSDRLVNYFKRTAKVPQGGEILELIHDRSIQHAFLDMIHVKSVPYRTVVDLTDIRRGIDSFGYPSILKPIQTSLLDGRQLIIKNQVDISKAAGMLEVGTYVLEPDLDSDRRFSVLVLKSKNGSLNEFPVVETHYHDHHLVSANACPGLGIQIKQRLKSEARKVAARLHYVGAIEISLVASKSRNIYVEGIIMPFDLVNDLMTFNGINVDQQYLKTLIGGTVHSNRTRINGIVERVSRDNYREFQRIWLTQPGVSLRINRASNSGEAFIMTDTPRVARKKLLADLKNY